ncbi:MAG: hypothetical protein P1P85_04165 [Patescibacteria group bacterium]|nr:hypothetical protein [Patescibacteria group bacterium]
METQRETIIFNTPHNHEVVMNAYLTGYEAREIRKHSFGEASEMDETENAMIDTLVVSVDGSADNILDRILMMRGSDYTSIIKKASSIIQNDFLDQAENMKMEK